MIGGLSMCELLVDDERQQDEHEEGARWNEHELTDGHKIEVTDGDKTELLGDHKVCDKKLIQNKMTGCHRIGNKGWYNSWGSRAR